MYYHAFIIEKLTLEIFNGCFQCFKFISRNQETAQCKNWKIRIEFFQLMISTLVYVEIVF